MGHVWDMYGTCMGYVWDMYERDIEHKAIKNPDLYRDLFYLLISVKYL